MQDETGHESVDHLCKITLLVEAGTDSGTMNLTGEPVRFEFVFGVNATGLTPFEYQLAAKVPGDVLRLCVSPQRWGEYFRHISLPGLPPPAIDSEVHLRVTVEQVRTAAGREVVKALAEMAECGGCDCGCGGHGGGFDPEAGGFLER